MEAPAQPPTVLVEIQTPRLQNIVATFSLSTKTIDLEKLAKVAPFLEFNAKRFAASVIRLVDPKTTCLVFASGKGVCTGAKTEDQARIASIKYVSLLRKTGFAVDFQFRNFRIQNIVSAVHCNFPLDLIRISNEVEGHVSYEPELFPGLMYRQRVDSHQWTRGSALNATDPGPRDGKKRFSTIVFICFQSGRCVITGGQSREQVLYYWRKFYYDVLVRFHSRVDFGSSGNYRVAQHKRAKTANSNDDWFLQQVSCSQKNPELVEGEAEEQVKERQALNALTDIEQIACTQNPEIRAMRALVDYIKDKTRMNTPSEGLYSPAGAIIS